MDSSTIILIDSYSQIYRGFYAIPGLKNSAGQPTNAVFAIARLLLVLRRQFPTDYGAFVFDLGRPAHRIEVLPQYKANRPPMPEDLSIQLPLVRKWIGLSGWPTFEFEGWEADDIISGFASEVRERQIRIVSSDKDLAQIVSDRVRLLAPEKKGGFEELDPGKVLEKFSVPPEKICDFLSLTGDSSDNIPGIEGVGPKTAAKILADYSSVEEIIANPGKIENQKLREKIVAGLEKIALNKKLVALSNSLPDPAWRNTELLRIREPDWDALDAMAHELGMSSISRDLESENKKSHSPATVRKKSEKKEETPDLFSF